MVNYLFNINYDINLQKDVIYIIFFVIIEMNINLFLVYIIFIYFSLVILLVIYFNFN